MAVEIRVPELGEDAEGGEVSFWYFEQGDRVKEGDVLLEVHTEKASVQIESTATGVLKEIKAGEGAKVKEGDILGIIEPA